MDALEYMKLLCGLLTAVIGVGGLKVYTDRRRYLQEVEKLKAEVRTADAGVRGNELDNVKKAMQIVMDEIVEPLKQEINAIRKELGKLRRAVEKANDCRLSADCPVRSELQGPRKTGAGYHSDGQSGHTPASLRAHPATHPPKHSRHIVSGGDAQGDARGDGV